jgi:YidC/Oxa1 family membrane protein insertase
LVTILTASGGLLGPIAGILGLIMNAIYEFFHLFGIQNIALSIIVFTFITKTLMLPLTIKQQKFTKLSSRMNPELQKIQAKYKGKKDEASLKKQQAETQAIYQRYGASPTSGCLPILITLPIMFALYSVINNIPAYVGQVKQMYEVVATATQATGSGYETILTTLAKGIARLTKLPDLTSVNGIIDVLDKFGSTKWNDFLAAFPNMQPNVIDTIDNIKRVNGFMGLNITNAPGWKFPGLIIPILAMVLQFIQGKQLQAKAPANNKDNPTANAMSSMTYIMPIMSGFFCVTFPIGIGLYWIATSVFAIIQQYFVNRYMDRVDIDVLIEKNVAKASKRKASLPAGGTSLQELAKKQTKSIESTVSDKGKSAEKVETKETQDEVEVLSETEQTAQPSNGPKSISEIANLLRNRNSEKGDK